MKTYSTLLALSASLLATQAWALPGGVVAAADAAGGRSAAAAARTAALTSSTGTATTATQSGKTSKNTSKTKTTTVTTSAVVSDHWRRVFTFSMGPDFVGRGQANNVVLSPALQNRYTREPGKRAAMDFGVFLGAERALTEKLSVQVGGAGYIDTTMTMNGYVWQHASLTQINSDYSYNVRNRRLVGAGKLLYAVTDTLRPYVSAEMGAALNQATNYNEVVIVPVATIQPPFSSQPTYSFTWGVGVGIEYLLTENMRFGGGYQFADLGTAALGPNPTQTTGQAPSIRNLYANQVRFQFSYLW